MSTYYEKMWEYTIPFTDKEGESVDAVELGGFMTPEQKDLIIEKNKNLKINNEIEITNELEVMLNEVVLSFFSNSEEEFDENEDNDELNKILDIAQNQNNDSDKNIKRGLIPADIIFANTIPVPNLRLFRNTNIVLGSNSYGGKVVYTVYMFADDILKFINISNSDSEKNERSTVVVGFIKRELIPTNGEREETCGYPIITDIGTTDPKLRIDRFHAMLPQTSINYFDNAPASEKMKITNTIIDVYIEMSTVLAQYYAIQQLLLNPLIKKYSSTDRVVDQFRKGGGKNGGKKKPVKYIKRIKLDTYEVTDLIYKKDENGNRTRKTLIWYVCGHWVNRKGKRYFRHGYWKGPLRDSNPEMFIDGVRQREIV